MAYQGHVSYSSFKHVGEAGDDAAVAGADKFGVHAQAPGSEDVGYAAYLNGYPRADGQPASSGHFGSN